MAFEFETSILSLKELHGGKMDPLLSPPSFVGETGFKLPKT